MSLQQHPLAGFRYPAERVPRLQVRGRDLPEPSGHDYLITTSTESSASSSSHDSRSSPVSRVLEYGSTQPVISSWSPDTSRTPSPFPATSKKRKAKERPSIFSFFSVREPSQSALKELSKQQKQLGGSIASGRPTGSGTSMQKLPAHVPKVNSKWDGMPNHFHTKERKLQLQNNGDAQKTVVQPPLLDTPTPFQRRASADNPQALRVRDDDALSRNFSFLDGNGGCTSATTSQDLVNLARNSQLKVPQGTNTRLRPDPHRSWSDSQLSGLFYGTAWRESTFESAASNTAVLDPPAPVNLPNALNLAALTPTPERPSSYHDSYTSSTVPVRDLGYNIPSTFSISSESSRPFIYVPSAPQTPPDSPEFLKSMILDTTHFRHTVNTIDGAGDTPADSAEETKLASTLKRPQLRIVTEGRSSSFLDPATPGAADVNSDDVDAILASATPTAASEPVFNALLPEGPEVTARESERHSPRGLPRDLSGESFWLDNDAENDDRTVECELPRTPVSSTSHDSDPLTTAASPVSPLSPRMPALDFVFSDSAKPLSGSSVREHVDSLDLDNTGNAMLISANNLQWPLPPQGLPRGFDGTASTSPPRFPTTPPRRLLAEQVARRPTAWYDDSPPASILITPPRNFSRSASPRTSLDGGPSLSNGIALAQKPSRSNPIGISSARAGLAGPPGRAVSRTGISLPSIPEADTASMRSRSDSVHSNEAEDSVTGWGMKKMRNQSRYAKPASEPMHRRPSVERSPPSPEPTLSSKDRLGLGSKVKHLSGTVPWALYQSTGSR